MEKNAQLLERMEEILQFDIPGYKRAVKEDSTRMKILNFFVKPFNDKFMKRFTTTWYPGVYAPRRIYENARFMWKILAHEWVHLLRAKKQTTLIHSALYGVPQILAALALLSLGAIWGSNWWLLNLLWLLMLAPLPAYFRAEEEYSGYTMSMAINYWRYGSVLPMTVEHLARNFYGPFYYFMWPFKKAVLRRFYEEAENIANGKYDDIRPYKDMKELIEEIWPKKS